MQVLAVVLVITTNSARTAISIYTGADILNQISAAAGWLLFVAVVAIVIEVFIITLRFLNLGLIEKYTLPLVITVRGGGGVEVLHSHLHLHPTHRMH